MEVEGAWLDNGLLLEALAERFSNITGGTDLTLGEATTINDIIHDAVGDDAEIIFGAATDPSMQGEVRVTVIATGMPAQKVHRHDRCWTRNPPMSGPATVARPNTPPM